MSLTVDHSARDTIDPENWNHRYRDYLIRFALKRVSDYYTAEDLVQDTFVSAWKARHRFRGDCSEKTFLTGVLRNKIIDHYRKTGRRQAVLAGDVVTAQDEDQREAWFDRQPDLRNTGQPVASTERAEFMADLEEAVSELPETMQKAFRMREFEGKTTEEITRDLDISSNNLWVLIHRAKHNLQDRLKPEWIGLSDFGVRENH